PGGTPLEKVIRHGNEPPPRVADCRPDVPAEVEEIVQRLLAKRPEDRFHTAAELAATLHPWAVSGPTPWAPPSSSPVIETGPTPLADDTPAPGDAGADPGDDLSALSDGVPDEALLPPAECVLAVRQEHRRRVRLKRVLLTAAIVAVNAVLWWALAHWM